MINDSEIQVAMDDATRFKRLRYRSWHRGCKETDVILGNFADSGLSALEPELLITYERLLDESDTDIWAWLTGHDAPEEYKALLEMMKQPVK